MVWSLLLNDPLPVRPHLSSLVPTLPDPGPSYFRPGTGSKPLQLRGREVTSTGEPGPSGTLPVTVELLLCPSTSLTYVEDE